jgi:hypothetical protein
MNRGRVGEERGGKETDGCPLTVPPDLFKEQTSSAFGIYGGMRRDEVRALGYTVNDIYNCIIAMGFRQFNYEVHADHVPWCLRCLRRVAHTNRSSTLHFVWLHRSQVFVRGHPSISLLPLSYPTLHLFICIPPPHLCTIFKDHT